MSKWKEGGGMQPSGQTADGTNNTTHSRLWLLIGPWWAFKQALLLTWQSAQHSSITSQWQTKVLLNHCQYTWKVSSVLVTSRCFHCHACSPWQFHRPNTMRRIPVMKYCYGLQFSASCRAAGLRENSASFDVWDVSQLMDKCMAYKHPNTVN